MKALDSFTVERLEELSVEEDLYNFPPTQEELNSLARIALAAKRAEPVGYWNDACDLDDGAFSYANDAGCTRPLYTTPQLNSPEIPEGWTSSDPANAALVMLDRIDTIDSADDDRIEDIKLIIRQLAAAPEKPL